MLFRSTLSLLFLASVSAGSLRADQEFTTVTLSATALFDAWTVEHERDYQNDVERVNRMNVWLANHERIELHNNQVPEPSYKLGHNAFSDMTEDEYAQQFNLGKYSNAKFAKLAAEDKLSTGAESMTHRQLDEVNLPDYVNWIAMGGVTPVKNQGSCGSCWAFSTTGALEGAKFVRTGELVALSEQNLLDCDHADLGCNGGLMDNAFKFDEKSGGLCSEEDYPYKAKQGKTCMTNCTDVPGSIVKTFYDVPPGKEKALLSAVAMQPISIAIQADQFPFQFYKTGVLTDDKCGKAGSIDHGVLLVGYGSDVETNEPYWMVKNSWGNTWGESGYIRMSRKSKNKFGMCAILKMASYPEVE